MSLIFILLILLFVKHYIADFWYQPPWQWQNKGTYGHPGGIVHSGQHVVITMFTLAAVIGDRIPWLTVLAICVAEFMIHYHMDWFKMWWTKKQGYTSAGPQFWVWLGIDQLVHSLTYIAMAWIVWLSL
jgi:hypothetical protein